MSFIVNKKARTDKHQPAPKAWTQREAPTLIIRLFILACFAFVVQRQNPVFSIQGATSGCLDMRSPRLELRSAFVHAVAETKASSS
jgi:hypothetical protein